MASPNPPDPASQSERARKLTGTTIGGRYKVLSLLGAGAMGEVFLVEHNVIRKRMALKLLSDEMLKNPMAVARFEREALAAAQIDHPNVAAATDSGRMDDGAMFVVFEYIDGQLLHDVISKGPLPPSLALHITRQVASALVRAHGLGIIHRDLKAENIMLVSRDGEPVVVKVLDFGLAKLSTELLTEAGDGSRPGQALTRFGSIFGTPAYMSPEQSTGGEVDARTDLYSLGVLLYEMLTSVLPFKGDEPAEQLRQHISAPVPSLASRVPELRLPPTLDAMVLKLLEKSPEHRYQSAKALLDSIDQLVTAESLQYPNPTSNTAKSPSELVTALAPPDLAARLFEALPPGEQDPELARALKRLKERSDEKASREMTSAAAAKADEPKSKGPSSLDIEVIPSNGTADAAPTPAPTVAGPSPLTVLGTQVAESSAKLRTQMAERYVKLLDAVRARLPERYRVISQRTLGVIVGAALSLPVLVLILIFAGSGDGSSSSAKGALPGFASDREMEKAVNGDVRDLAKLAAKYPSDSRVFRILARAHVARKDHGGALRALASLARLDPTMASDDEMLQIATSAALLPETSDSAISLLESQLGDKGVAALSDLAERTATEPWKSKLSASLQKGTTRSLASEATLILLDLRAAQRCEDKRGLLRRAGQQGDGRTLAYLQGLQQMMTGCGANGQSDCWGCLRRGTALKATMDAISKRLGG